MKNLEIIVEEVIEESFYIHKKLGPGLLESVYEVILANRLEKKGFKVERQKSISINFDGICLNEGFRIDLLIDDILIVELKSVEDISPVHSKQVLTYLKMMNLQLGLLINFGSALMKDGIKRIANGYGRQC